MKATFNGGGDWLKIYVLTRGSYSDYHIITATTDYKLAKQLKEKFERTNDYYSDEIYIEVYENAEVYMRPCYFLRFDKSGNVIEASDDCSEYAYRTLNQGLDVKGNYYVNLIADNSEAAIKIGAEKRAMFLAEKEGIS